MRIQQREEFLQDEDDTDDHEQEDTNEFQLANDIMSRFLPPLSLNHQRVFDHWWSTWIKRSNGCNQGPVRTALLQIVALQLEEEDNQFDLDEFLRVNLDREWTDIVDTYLTN